MKASEFAAHAPDAVLNQPPALENYNLFASDRPLNEALSAKAAAGSRNRLTSSERFWARLKCCDLASWPTVTRPCCAHTTASVIVMTKSSSIRRGTM